MNPMKPLQLCCRALQQGKGFNSEQDFFNYMKLRSKLLGKCKVFSRRSNTLTIHESFGCGASHILNGQKPRGSLRSRFLPQP